MLLEHPSDTNAFREVPPAAVVGWGFAHGVVGQLFLAPWLFVEWGLRVPDTEPGGSLIYSVVSYLFRKPRLGKSDKSVFLFLHVHLSEERTEPP